jgi:hypothetical protein
LDPKNKNLADKISETKAKQPKSGLTDATPTP